MENKKNFYITTPIFYPNANPHMGHAYSSLLCDVLARYHRLLGVETYFLTGTDEHTEKVVQAAMERNQAADEYLEVIVARFKNLYAELGISYDQFIRTSDRTIHWPGAIEMWNRLFAAGDIYKAKYEGLYCVGCESFLTEKDLVGGMCPDHSRVPERVTEENYFFRLSKYSDEIRKLILSDTVQIFPAVRKNETLAFIDGGLKDVSFSRPNEKMSWGIPVPGDPGQTMYIWVDALTNYITALGFGRGEENMRFWPGMHIIGKDILRFHTIFWPAMLLSAKIQLPRTILVHGLITSEGKKMSKTLGNVIDPFELLAEYGTDAVRYFLVRHVHPFEDSDITKESFKEAYNANLANGLGNLVARVMKLAEDNLPAPVERPAPKEFPEEYVKAIEAFELNHAMDFIWNNVQKLDERITKEEPFKLIKSKPEAGRVLIAELVVELYQVGRMLNPFMPETSKKIKEAILANKKPETLFPRKD